MPNGPGSSLAILLFLSGPRTLRRLFVDRCPYVCVKEEEAPLEASLDPTACFSLWLASEGYTSWDIS